MRSIKGDLRIDGSTSLRQSLDWVGKEYQTSAEYDESWTFALYGLRSLRGVYVEAFPVEGKFANLQSVDFRIAIL